MLVYFYVTFIESKIIFIGKTESILIFQFGQKALCFYYNLKIVTVNTSLGTPS